MLERPSAAYFLTLQSVEDKLLFVLQSAEHHKLCTQLCHVEHTWQLGLHLHWGRTGIGVVLHLYVRAFSKIDFSLLVCFQCRF